MHNLPVCTHNIHLTPKVKIIRYHFAVVAGLYAVTKGVNLNRDDDYGVAVRHGIVFG